MSAATLTNIEASWKALLADEFKQDYFLGLQKFLKDESEAGHEIYPPADRIYAAFDFTPVKKVKAVIIGQDPYHGAGQANGLSFSVADGVRKPPSLVNILKELERDLGIPVPVSGNLESWAHHGVLLLNAILTVRAGIAASHQGKGWEQFTDAAISALSQHSKGIVFLLWGKYAQAKESLIDTSRHHILKAAHPSPLAQNKFSGCKHFSKTNELLEKDGHQPINWTLP